MADIYHQFQIQSPIDKVFLAISEPAGLDAWWSKKCSGKPEQGAIYNLYFGPGYNWQARVTLFRPDNDFQLEMVDADADWTGSRINFNLKPENGKTSVFFLHTGWPALNDHYRISCYCWAMYLRLLKRYVEYGEVVSYDERLEV
jgi:uncharacterized protein YndB with AHSA1/START domain